MHLHGGELSYGSYDESFRHSITKMSYWHFVATKNSMQEFLKWVKKEIEYFI